MSDIILDRTPASLPIPTKKYAFIARKPGRIAAIVFRPIRKRREGFFETNDEHVAQYLIKLAKNTGGCFKQVETRNDISKMGWQEIRTMAKEMGMPNWFKSNRQEIEKYVSENKS